MVGGPNYETVAELKMLRELGVDSVGMSTIPETIAAHHCGMKVFACSLITNMCVVEYGTGIDTNHDEVIEVRMFCSDEQIDQINYWTVYQCYKTAYALYIIFALLFTLGFLTDIGLIWACKAKK